MQKDDIFRHFSKRVGKRKRNLKIVYLRVKAIVAEVLRVWDWKNRGLVVHSVKILDFVDDMKNEKKKRKRSGRVCLVCGWLKKSW